MRPINATIPALLALLLAGACHYYTPASPTSVNQGDQIRALLTAEHFAQVQDALPGEDRRVEGTVVQAEAAVLLIEVPLVTSAQGNRVESYSQRLRVPKEGIADIEVRSLARGRTVAVASAAAALLGLLAWDQLFSDAGSSDQRPPDPTSEFRRIMIRIPVAR